MYFGLIKLSGVFWLQTHNISGIEGFDCLDLKIIGEYGLFHGINLFIQILKGTAIFIAILVWLKLFRLINARRSTWIGYLHKFLHSMLFIIDIPYHLHCLRLQD